MSLKSFISEDMEVTMENYHNHNREFVYWLNETWEEPRWTPMEPLGTSTPKSWGFPPAASFGLPPAPWAPHEPEFSPSACWDMDINAPFARAPYVYPVDVAPPGFSYLTPSLPSMAFSVPSRVPSMPSYAPAVPCMASPVPLMPYPVSSRASSMPLKASSVSSKAPSVPCVSSPAPSTAPAPINDVSAATPGPKFTERLDQHSKSFGSKVVEYEYVPSLQMYRVKNPTESQKPAPKASPEKKSFVESLWRYPAPSTIGRPPPTPSSENFSFFSTPS